MTLAKRLISEIAEALVAGKSLSGKEVAELQPKQHVFINGKRAIVLDVLRSGSSVDLIYMTGTKLLGPEKTLTVPLSSSTSGVYAAVDVVEGYKITRGMKKAYEKLSASRGVRRCPSCDSIIPKYPGKYPSKCPHCKGELEDYQNSPVYSENDRNKVSAQMRRIPKDRIGNE